MSAAYNYWHRLRVSSISMNRRCKLLIAFFLLTSWLGCDDAPEIRQYRVSKERSDLGDLGTNVPAERPASRPVLNQMFVAIASRSDATWFFKLTGPVAAMKETQDQWKQLLTDIDFNEQGEPVWEATEDWKQGPARQFRFATLLRSTPENGNVELSISSLGPNQNMLDNVNRWLGQLGKSPIEKEQLKLESMKYRSGEFKIFDENGMLSTSGMMPSTSPAATAIAPSEPELTYEVPEGWKKGKVNSIVKVRLLHGDEPTSPQISVTQLMAAANQWIPNAQRWARQVDMDTSPEFAEKNSSKVNVDGIEGNKVRLISDDKSKERGLIGIMIVRGELAWFFKMFGDREEIAPLEGDFDKFVESFSFK